MVAPMWESGLGPNVEPVTPDSEVPAQAEVVIIGGGIIGTTTALFLAQKGIPVVLCEKGHIAGEQSSRNWGWCRRMGRDPRELELSVEALNLWSQMHQMVGEDVGFRNTGIMYLCPDEASVEKRLAWIAMAGEYALDTRMVRGRELEDLLPGAARPWAGALYTASDARAEPQKAAPAIARAAQRLGATILTDCAVRSLDIAAGRVAGVITERGRIACGTVVLAGGAWSEAFCFNHGVRLPQLLVRSSVLRTAPLDGVPEIACWAPGFAFRKRADGGYTIANGGIIRHEIVPKSFRYLRDYLPVLRQSPKDVEPRITAGFLQEWRWKRTWSGSDVTPFEEVRTLDPAPVDRHLDQATEDLFDRFPAFRHMKVEQRWAGMIDTTPDAVPVISPVEGLSGFIVATGFSGHGFGIGPGAGALITDMITGERPRVDPTPYRHSRFTDGSVANPIAGL
ncbi:NAD(P)/FAD-dependent oxidoreductase [Zavarzinia sp. CC-PAN008]|uniref:NAD(P)/FAD-dependent oxidoreductase n=1 Tax=Zavarzinia sp. CC-PAN008 TaxID=3243332 RepID=UPI003F7499D0